MWFRLIQDRYDERIAFLSTFLFITTPYIVGYSRIVMSEIPALALLLTASYYLQQYLNDEKRKHLILFVVSFVLSVYAKQTAVIFGLVFAWEFVATKGFRKIFTKDVLWAGVAYFIAMIPIGTMTLALSPSNVKHFSSAPMEYILKPDILLQHAQVVFAHHLTPPVFFLSLIGIALGLWKRDPRCHFFVVWIIVFYLFVTYTGARSPRYTMFWIPAFCLFVASLVNFFPSRYWKIGMGMVVLVISGAQAVIAYNLESTFARGYKEAARYVVEEKKGAAVLYSAHVDTGYFVFYTRARDSAKDMIVLQAEKILATSFLGYLTDDRIKNKDSIYKILENFGVCHVVLEDKPSKSRSIEWLRSEVQKDHLFILKKIIPIQTNYKKLQGVALKIYEYKSCGPPNPDAVLEMNLPLINHSIKVSFDKLVKGL